MTALMVIPKPSREAVAHHEAGHVVAALAVGASIADATIAPTADALGRVRRSRILGGMEFHAQDVESGDALRRWRGRAACLNEARFAVAGPIAEGIYTGSPWWRPWSAAVFLRARAERPHPVSFGDDVLGTVRALEIAAEGTMAFLGYQNRVGREMRAFLADRWRIVEDVAALLLREETVDGDTVEESVWESAERHGLDMFPESIVAPWWKMPRAAAAAGEQVTP